MTPFVSRRLEKALERLESHPVGVRFAELRWICETVFGEGRQSGGSHLIFATGIPDQPIVNIQADGTMAKAYQCRQVARAVRQKLQAGLEREGQ